jgi:heme-degrading monooxygenase HmoA
VVALFEHRLRAGVDLPEWEQAFGRMVGLALEVPGFVSVNRYAAADGSAMAVVRFDSVEALESWRSDPEHVRTQQRGREAFFESYRMTVATPVVREYAWQR